MNITSEHIKILECLKKNSYSSRELSEILGTTEIKIKTQLSLIESALSLKTSSTSEISHNLKSNPVLLESIRNLQSPTPKERELFILLSIMRHGKINLNEIARKLAITRRSITGDFNNAKIKLEERGLSTESLNSIGIVLIGETDIIENYFKNLLIKLEMEKRWLPRVFNEFIDEIEYLNEKNSTFLMIEEVVASGNVLKNTFTVMNIEILAYIFILKRDFNFLKYHRSLSSPQEKDRSDLFLKINSTLKKYNFSSENCNNSLLNFILRNSLSFLADTYRSELKNAEDFIALIQEKIGFKLRLSLEVITIIAMRLEITKFKQNFEIRDFYPWNRDLPDN